jgi:hypothetical protein
MRCGVILLMETSLSEKPTASNFSVILDTLKLKAEDLSDMMASMWQNTRRHFLEDYSHASYSCSIKNV